MKLRRSPRLPRFSNDGGSGLAFARQKFSTRQIAIFVQKRFAAERSRLAESIISILFPGEAAPGVESLTRRP